MIPTAGILYLLRSAPPDARPTVEVQVPGKDKFISQQDVVRQEASVGQHSKR